MGEVAGERSGPPRGLGRPGHPPRPGARGITGSIFVLEHAQDVVTVVVGLVLVVLAAILLISGIADFVHGLMATRIFSAESIVAATTTLLDEVLLVLILVEVVHTVVLSLRSHRLVAQPFIIVGLVAVIRKILFVLSSEKLPSASVLALLIAMVAVFIVGLIAVNRFDQSEDPDSAGP